MLKHLLCLFPGLLMAGYCPAQTPRQVVKPPLTNVTVYLNGSVLEHQAQVPLVAGLNRLVISGLSFRVDSKDLEAELGDGADLLAVDDEDGEADKPKTLAINQTAVDSLARAETELAKIDGELQGLQQEKTFLLANQTLPAGTQLNWSAEVQKGAAIMRMRMPAIQIETNKLQARQKELTALTALLKPRASETADNGQQVLLVRAERAGTVPLSLRYFVSGRLPWLAKLDIRADAAGKVLKFVPHGRLRNTSGLDWQRVKLVLMRFPLGDDVSRPSLQAWSLDFEGGDHVGEGRVDEFVVKGTAKGRTVDVSQGSRYEVPEPVTLAAGQRRDLTLPEIKLAARPEYLAIPRLSEHVFLQAKVTGWQGLQLPETASVYHQSIHVGETRLNDRAYNDSLEVSLGHDEGLVVGRAKLEDYSSNAGFGDKRRVRLSYELNVQNRHPETVRLRLFDQIPISEEKEINIKALDLGGAELDERTGKLTWVLTLPPGTNRRVRFSFQVDYPKDKRVEIINHQVRISSPKFR